jgi:hypothetical protein
MKDISGKDCLIIWLRSLVDFSASAGPAILSPTDGRATLAGANAAAPLRVAMRRGNAVIFIIGVC